MFQIILFNKKVINADLKNLTTQLKYFLSTLNAINNKATYKL